MKENVMTEKRKYMKKIEIHESIIEPVSIARWLLLFVLITGIYFFHSFIVPVLAALVIGFACWPSYSKFKTKFNLSRNVAASMSIVLLILFLVIPISIAVSYAISEFHDFSILLIAMNKTGVDTPLWLVDIPIVGELLSSLWTEKLSHPNSLSEIMFFFGNNINPKSLPNIILAIGGTLFNFILSIIFMMITLFFVFRNGDVIASQINKVGEYVLHEKWEKFSKIVPMTISSTITGMTLIAIGEGFVLGIAYWVAGAPSPVTLGVITGIMAMIPGGAPLSFSLVSFYLMANGSPTEGLLLLIWGSLELFVVDKTLRPKLVGGPIKLPFLPTFFGLIGGMKTMGFLGLFLGPVIMAVIVSIWREWVNNIDEQETQSKKSVVIT